MITIKGNNEADILARIEKELKGEEVDIFQSEDVDYTLEQVALLIADNAKKSRVYIGRLERNTRKIEEDMRDMHILMEPIALYFSRLIEDMYPDHMLPYQTKKNKDMRLRTEQREKDFEMRREEERQELGLKGMLNKQREISEQLKAEGKSPKE